MTSIMSKRQQARNEKVLHDLVQTVPGNNFCADCQTRNPGMSEASRLLDMMGSTNVSYDSLGILERTSHPLSPSSNENKQRGWTRGHSHG